MPTSYGSKPSEAQKEQKRSLPTLRLKPLRGRILVSSLHESRGNFLDSPLVVPDAARSTGRYFGWIVGVPDGEEELGFGDLVKLPRWGGLWMFQPFYSLADASPNPDTKGEYVDRFGRGSVYGINRDSLLVTTKDALGGGIATREEIVNGVYSEQPIRPLGSRIVVRHVDRPEISSGGILLPNMDRWHEPLAQVLDVGEEVDGIEVGDWVFVDPWKGSWWASTVDGKDYSLLRSEDVFCYWKDGQAPETVEYMHQMDAIDSPRQGRY